MLAQIDLAPPLVALGKVCGWTPLPLTIKEGRAFVRADRRPPTVNQGRGIRDWGLGTRRQEDKETGDRRQETGDSTQNSKLKTQNSVELSHVHFSYGEHEALYNLSIAARPGEVLALMGRNGSGKTTLLKLIIGLLKPLRGAVTVLGRDVTRMDVEDMAAFVGYVPQDPRALLFHDTLREELAFTLDHRPPTADHRSTIRSIQSKIQNPKSKIEETLEQFGLGDLAQTYPRDLSGGEAQRAALATILVGDPQVLLLDEPTRGLDYRAKRALGRLLRALAHDGRIVIMSTHDVELVAAHADRVALLGEGELIVEGPVREVLSDSLIFSSQIAKLFPGTGWLTVEDVTEGGGTAGE